MPSLREKLVAYAAYLSTLPTEAIDAIRNRAFTLPNSRPRAVKPSL